MTNEDDVIKPLQARILQLENELEQIKKRPATPDTSGEVKSLRDELFKLRAELGEVRKAREQEGDGEGTDDEKEGEGDDIELGHFGGR